MRIAMLAALLSTFVIPIVTLEPILVEGQLCHPRHIVIETTEEKRALRIAGKNAKVVKRYPQVGFIVLDVPTKQLASTRRKLADSFGEKYVEYDGAGRPAYEPNDTLWPDMWHAKAIKADLAWDTSFGSDNTIVAIIDTGVNVNHPDLAGNIWKNPGEIPGNGIDDDGNGYIDDIVGWDFNYNDNDPNDVNGHGTACAGLAAAVMDNNAGVCGIAPRAKIMCLKSSTDSGYFYDTNDADAYIYALTMGAKVISCSFFSDRVSGLEKKVIYHIADMGVLPVVAAGNASNVYSYYPAAYEASLAIAAIDTNLNKAGFSNFGSWVDVAAPGVSLRTTTASGGYTSGFGGTSGSTPQVAGIAALLFGAVPGATNVSVRHAIEDSATQVSQAPFGEYCNYGIVNAQLALQLLMSGTEPARDGVVRWISPFGKRSVPNKAYMRVYGRRIGRGYGTFSMNGGGFEFDPTGPSRDYTDIAGPVSLMNSFHASYPGGTLDVDTTNVPFCFPMIEGASPGASVFGGFWDALMDDGVYVRCTRRSDGVIRYYSTFRMIDRTNLTLTFKRRITGAATGNERIKIYDWSTGSYPYGSYVTLRDAPIVSGWQTFTVPLSNVQNYMDEEGTIYFQVESDNGQPSGSELQIDVLRLLIVE
ncbi:MAG: S8 family serine peptidase [Fimbriimonadaceae bacterium]|nr:S8 family serine peptidase [Fimbriimonadaceae bacterium]